MPISRLAPASVTLTNLTGTVSAIQDDPDSPDANWLLTNSGGASVCSAVFSKPSLRMTGNASQEVRVLTRVNASAGNAVTFRIDFIQNGVTIATSGTLTAPATGTAVSSVTVPSINFSDLFGSNIQVDVTQLTGNSGQTASRRYLEIGAIEWNADLANKPARVTLTL